MVVLITMTVGYANARCRAAAARSPYVEVIVVGKGD
jgi:hypothetical protein